MQVLSPIDGTVVATPSTTSPDEVRELVRRAAAAQYGWNETAPTTRGQLLHRVGALIRRDQTELAELESRNTGKLLADTNREVERAAACFEYYAGWADKVTGRTIPVPGAFHTYTDRVPHGVAAGIIPWNVPFFFAAKKMAPALAFGNATVVKPAPETPLTALLLRELVVEAGIPEDLVHVVVGGTEVGEALITAPETSLVVFTGHPDTGRIIAHTAAESLTPVALELGGKSPQVVFGDADLDAAADAIVLGVFASCGQMCIAGSRVLVDAAVADDLLDRLASRVDALRVGSPFDPRADLGPQVTRAQRDKTQGFIDGGRAAGARVAAQAPLPDDPALAEGYFVQPTLFADVDPDSPLVRDEVFGPVLATMRFDFEEEAIALAKDTPFGLAAGLWTRDVSRAHRVARQLRVGNVWINSYRVLSDLVPFGGFGLSGYGRENAEEAVNLYTTTRAIWTALEPGRPAGYRLSGDDPTTKDTP